jgi:hypothetical protein
MPIRQKQYPMRFTPKGLCDAYDATDAFPGACVSLANLAFNEGNPEIMISRPGVPALVDFAAAGFANPAFISVHVTIGEVVYGMVATTRNAGKDEPFAYDISAGAFIVISGVTNANTPTSPATTGPWVPPTIASIGTKLIFTHPGFPGGATKFGTLDISNPALPAWSAGDTASNGLTATPSAVANYNNRAYFAVANTLQYSDVLDPNTRTSSTQSLTLGDTTVVTALNGLPIQTTSSGVIGALIAFKGFQIWQITGDSALSPSTLAENYLSLTVGTQAPRSVAQSPLGLYFASSAGPKIIDQYGVVRAVTHSAQEINPDLQVAWQNMTTPSRVSGAYSDDVYRICMDTVLQGQSVTNDYWFDENKRRWNGPHTFSYDCASQHDDAFVLSYATLPGKLFTSRTTPNLSTVYTDNGVAIMVTLKSSTFPKTGDMEMKQVVESTMELASTSTPTQYAITGMDDQSNTLNNCAVTVPAVGTLWGAGVWGGFTWGSSLSIPTTYNVPWTLPLVFKKMAIYITSAASSALLFGTFFARYQNCGYTNNKAVP